MGQSTWAAKTTTWATDTNVWSNSTYQNTATFSAANDTSLGYNTKYPVAANMTQTIFSELHEEDAIKLASAVLGLSSGATASASVVAQVAALLSNTQNLKNNVNFEERATIGMAGSISSDNNFLWNDNAEDTSTTWTKVADPDN